MAIKAVTYRPSKSKTEDFWSSWDTNRNQSSFHAADVAKDLNILAEYKVNTIHISLK